MNTSSVDTRWKHSYDRQDTRQRVAMTNVVRAGSDRATPEMVQQIWARRAAQLAQVPTQENKGEQIELVVVQLGRERYGLDARLVFGIKHVERVARVPRVPEWVAGVVNVRGHILSVVDLRRFFGLPAGEPNEGEPDRAIKANSHLVIVETPEMELVLLTDGVLAVEKVPTSRIQDTTHTVRGLPPGYVRGVVEFKGGGPTTNGKTLVVVLDLPVLLADERLIVREEIV